MMVLTFARLRFPRLLAVGLLAAAVAGCGDNPVGDDEEHPVGMVLLSPAGQTVVTIAVGPTVTGSITLPVNGSATYTVMAVSETGARLALDGTELSVRIATQPQNATAAVQGTNQLTVSGRTAGTGTLRLELMHGGHAELGGNVPVVVQ